MKNTKFNIIAMILIIVFCIAISPITLQNDTYYTISIGEHIMQNGLDMQDPYSWHEGLAYTYPHWLYDVIIYLICSLGNVLGGALGGFTAIYISTCVFASVLGILLYIVNKKIAKNNVISFFITLGVMFLLKDYIAARAQLVTFILFVLEIFFIEKFLENKKIQYAIGLIIIPILIANLHIAVWYFYFVLYLPYIAEYIISLIFRYKKGEQKEKDKIVVQRNENIKYLIIIMIICAFTGLITPYRSFEVYRYLPQTMVGISTKNIGEHLPMVIVNNLPMISTLIIVIGVLTFTNSKIKLRDLFMLGGLLLLMLYSQRQQTMFVLAGGIILNKLIIEILNSGSKDGLEQMEKDISKTVALIIITVFVSVLSISIIMDKKGNTYIDETTYPVQMSEWILENTDVKEMKLFNEYNYGSYLLYKGIPVFIDSRADLYLPEFNKDVKVFEDFIKSSSLDVFYEDVFKKYDITHILLYKKSKMNLIIKNTNDGKYKLLHEDNYFVFYERQAENKSI